MTHVKHVCWCVAVAQTNACVRLRSPALPAIRLLHDVPLRFPYGLPTPRSADRAANMSLGELLTDCGHAGWDASAHRPGTSAASSMVPGCRVEQDARMHCTRDKCTVA
jgi:hypothetical protein